MYNEDILILLQQAVAKPLWEEIKPPIFMAEVGNKAVGTWLQLYLSIENNRIAEVRYRVLGSGYLIATVEWVNRLLTGASLETAKTLTAQQIVTALALPPQRHYCARMVVEAVSKIFTAVGF